MKTKIRIFILTFLITLIFDKIRTQGCYLTKVISGLDSTMITYDENNHITSLGVGTSVTTDSKGYITEITRTRAGAPSELLIDTRTIYIYDSKNHLAEERVIGFNETTPRKITKYM
ncbi:MAG: hypothetical protein HYR67_03925 [Bacteroidetes bacterium]|nr:hypothetical protein [Bacteroidota bacterium]